MSPHTSIAVTGMGVVSALASNLTSHYRRLSAGESGIVERSPENALPTKTWAPVQRSCYHERIQNRMLRKLLQPSAAMAVVAAGEALADAGLLGDAVRLQRSGLFVGSVSFEMSPDVFLPALNNSVNREGEFDLKYFANRGMAQLDPLMIVKGLPNAGLCGIAMEFGVLGPNLNIANDSVGGIQAIAAAMRAIARGDSEVAIVGGYDSLLQPGHMVTEFLRGRLNEMRRCCYTVGEGAAMCVLESIDHARCRGAGAYAEILSAEENCGEAEDDYAAQAAVARRAIEAAAQENCEQVPRIIFGDLSGIPHDDDRELSAAYKALGEAAAITGHVGSLGFTGAASGVFSFIHAALSLSTGVVSPAVRRCAEPSTQPVRIITQAEQANSDTRLIWHSGEGVKNVAIVLKRSDQQRTHR